MNAHDPSSRPDLFATARLVVLIAICSCSSPLQAQIASQPVPAPVQPSPKKLNAEELGHLLAPIALYPDALIAIILPASTVPADVVLGARYLKSKGDPGKTESQPWDESVKALARYPEVLAWMDESLEWTASLGEAFVEQPADVMNAIQALREQAKAAGNLGDTPQQKVVEEESAIRIVPADPEVIYVPQYDPQVIYVYSSVLTFGPGFYVGPWLCYDFDWHRRRFHHGDWRGWHHEYNWNHALKGNGGGANVVNIDTANAIPWQPSANALRQIHQRQANNNGNARYVNACSGTVATQQPVAQGNASVRAAHPGIYNPVLKTALPQPSKLERSPIGDGRNQAPVCTGKPTNNPIRSEPTRTIPQNPGTSVPTTTQPTQTAPLLKKNHRPAQASVPTTIQPTQTAPVVPQRPP